MICPLQSMRLNTSCACDKEDCAWWNKEMEQCCIVTIVENVDDLIKGQRTIYTREV